MGLLDCRPNVTHVPTTFLVHNHNHIYCNKVLKKIYASKDKYLSPKS